MTYKSNWGLMKAPTQRHYAIIQCTVLLGYCNTAGTGENDLNNRDFFHNEIDMLDL